MVRFHVEGILQRIPMLKATPEILDMIATNTYAHSTLVITAPCSRTHSELWIPSLVRALQTNTHIKELFIYAREMSDRCAQLLLRLKIAYTFIPKVLPDVLFTCPSSPLVPAEEMRERPATPTITVMLDRLMASIPEARPSSAPSARESVAAVVQPPMPAPIPIPLRSATETFIPSSPEDESKTLRLRADTPHPSPA
jgi:hypothetical protein